MNFRKRSGISAVVIAFALATLPLPFFFDDLMVSSARAQDSGGDGSGGDGSDGGAGDGSGGGAGGDGAGDGSGGASGDGAGDGSGGGAGGSDGGAGDGSDGGASGDGAGDGSGGGAGGSDGGAGDGSDGGASGDGTGDGSDGSAGGSDGGAGAGGSGGGAGAGSGSGAGGNSGGGAGSGSEAASAGGESGPEIRRSASAAAGAPSEGGLFGSLIGTLFGSERAETPEAPAPNAQSGPATSASPAEGSVATPGSTLPAKAAIVVQALPDITVTATASETIRQPDSRRAKPAEEPGIAAAPLPRRDSSKTDRRAAAARTPDPRVAEVGTPGDEPVTIVTRGDAWVHVTEAGTVIFQGILSPGESFVVPPGIRAPQIWAGNAGTVYLQVGPSLYGPVGDPGSVVRNFPIRAQDVTARLAVADAPAVGGSIAEAEAAGAPAVGGNPTGQGAAEPAGAVEDGWLLAAKTAPESPDGAQGAVYGGSGLAAASAGAMSWVPSTVKTAPAEPRAQVPVLPIAVPDQHAVTMAGPPPVLAPPSFEDLPAGTQTGTLATDADDRLTAAAPAGLQAVTDVRAGTIASTPAPAAAEQAPQTASAAQSAVPPVPAGASDEVGPAERRIVLASVIRDEATARTWIEMLAVFSLLAAIVAAWRIQRHMAPPRVARPHGESGEDPVYAGLARILGVQTGPDDEERPLQLSSHRALRDRGIPARTPRKAAQALSPGLSPDAPVSPVRKADHAPSREVVELSDREISEAVARAFNRLEAGSSSRRRA